ncbi:MAG: NERD domain-containing protein [Actinomycetota bacterium]|nr:NERD domain-containing protein [Actinomycetota bacterium]
MPKDADERALPDSVTVRRWSRYGADRLYVTDDTGRRVGSIDLISGEVNAESPVLEGGLRLAAQEFLRTDEDEVTLPITLPDVPRPPRPSEAVQDGEHVPADIPVGERLDRLRSDGWAVLHDVPLSRQGDVVQHLLVGPGGIYAITVHVHLGSDVQVDRRSLYVNHRTVPYLRDARLQAHRLERVLGAASSSFVSVRAVVVVHTGALAAPRVTKMPDDALVLGRTDIPGVFRRLPRRLTDDDVAMLAATALRKETWTLP